MSQWIQTSEYVIKYFKNYLKHIAIQLQKRITIFMTENEMTEGFNYNQMHDV